MCVCVRVCVCVCGAMREKAEHFKMNRSTSKLIFFAIYFSSTRVSSVYISSGRLYNLIAVCPLIYTMVTVLIMLLFFFIPGFLSENFQDVLMF